MAVTALIQDGPRLPSLQANTSSKSLLCATKLGVSTTTTTCTSGVMTFHGSQLQKQKVLPTWLKTEISPLFP